VKPLGRKTVDEMIVFLEEEVSAIAIDFSQLSEGFQKGFHMGIDLYVESWQLNAKIKDLEFFAYLIPKNQKGSQYYQYPYEPMIVEGYGDDLICVILVKPLEDYIFCNCNKLFLDLCVERGIGEYDYENDTMKLVEYLSHFEFLENKWY
jgi:hypothetical protein